MDYGAEQKMFSDLLFRHSSTELFHQVLLLNTCQGDHNVIILQDIRVGSESWIITYTYIVSDVSILHTKLNSHLDSVSKMGLKKKPVTTMLTYPWKCTVLHCNHLGNTWKPLVLMT